MAPVEQYVQSCPHIGPIAMPFDQIPVLEGDPRLDRVWRFVAMIFLLHEGLIAVCQHGQTIEVMQVGDD